jgi:hypothetical protein
MYPDDTCGVLIGNCHAKLYNNLHSVAITSHSLLLINNHTLFITILTSHWPVKISLISIETMPKEDLIAVMQRKLAICY